MVLIGSLARGDWSARSDADIVVLVDGADAPGRSRGPQYAPVEHPGIVVDLFVYTPDEQRTWSPRFRKEVEQGIRLYRR